MEVQSRENLTSTVNTLNEEDIKVFLILIFSAFCVCNLLSSVRGRSEFRVWEVYGGIHLGLQLGFGWRALPPPIFDVCGVYTAVLSHSTYSHCLCTENSAPAPGTFSTTLGSTFNCDSTKPYQFYWRDYFRNRLILEQQDNASAAISNMLVSFNLYFMPSK